MFGVLRFGRGPDLGGTPESSNGKKFAKQRGNMQPHRQRPNRREHIAPDLSRSLQL